MIESTMKKKTKTGTRKQGMTQISISMSMALQNAIEEAGSAENRNRSNYITTVLEKKLKEDGFLKN